MSTSQACSMIAAAAAAARGGYLDKLKEWRKAGVLYGTKPTTSHHLSPYSLSHLTLMMWCVCVCVCVCVARSSLKEGCNKPSFRGLGKAKLYKIPYVQAWLNEKSFKDIASASPEVLTLSLSLCVCVCASLLNSPSSSSSSGSAPIRRGSKES